MLDDPRVIQAAIAGTITAAIGFGLVLPAIRKLPMQQLQKGTDPKPADPKIKAPMALGLSKWQSGIVGPRDKHPEVMPYLGKHIIALDDDRVAVRAGGGTHHWRFVLFVMILAPILFVGVVLEFQEIMRFAFRGGSCITYVPVEGGIDPVMTPVSKTPWGYVTMQYCYYALIFDPNSLQQTLGEKVFAATDFMRFPFLIIAFVGITAALSIFRKTPPPLVFDRRRKLVYTYHNGQVWAAPWDGLQMRTFVGAFITTPAFALFENGTGRGAWFVLAGYHAGKELRAWRLNTLGLNWMRRWDGMRCWLVVFMEQGRTDLHPQFAGRGFGDLIAPRQAQLPADIDALVDQLDMPSGQKEEMKSSMAALLRQGDRRVLSAEDCNLKVVD